MFSSFVCVRVPLLVCGVVGLRCVVCFVVCVVVCDGVFTSASCGSLGIYGVFPSSSCASLGSWCFAVLMSCFVDTVLLTIGSQTLRDNRNG